MNRSQVQKLMDETLTALAPLAVKHGLAVSIDGGRFGKSGTTLKVEFATIGEDGEVNNAEREAFKLFAPLHGIPAEMLDTCFAIRNEEFKIIGWNTRAKKHPVKCIRVLDGKRFKMPASAIPVWKEISHA